LCRYVRECSGTDWSEMYKVFNCGHRMEVYCAAEDAEAVIAVGGLCTSNPVHPHSLKARSLSLLSAVIAPAAIPRKRGWFQNLDHMK
jgi:hypothetical protein